jgi:hypothetical protein
VGASVDLDITLAVKGATEQVEVTATAVAVDTTSPGVTQLLNVQSVSNLPLSGRRDYRDLAQLSPSRPSERAQRALGLVPILQSLAQAGATHSAFCLLLCLNHREDTGRLWAECCVFGAAMHIPLAEYFR